MTVTIRAIEEKDKGQWLNLWAGYLEFYKSTISIEQTELTWKRLINNELKMFGFVAEN
ncbi:MAG: hypothetical protein JHD01_06485, partial [Candidatus Nanopelagicales bacterium]|nr:hypothetical protein [Candidatus Nanopelagicales bacterium]